MDISHICNISLLNKEYYYKLNMKINIADKIGIKSSKFQ
jgi:hypothetical protein